MSIPFFQLTDRGYCLWQPQVYPLNFDCESTPLGNTSIASYERFSDVVHSTHYNRTAENILRVGAIQVAEPKDQTRYRGKVVWMAGTSKPNSDYGSVTFRLEFDKWLSKEGDALSKENRGLHFYFVEMIDYSKTESASRILISRDPNINVFQVYNPNVRGGPWWRDGNGNHFSVLRTKECPIWHQGNPERHHTLEFLFDSDVFVADIERITIQEHDVKRCKLWTKREENCVDRVDSQHDVEKKFYGIAASVFGVCPTKFAFEDVTLWKNLIEELEKDCADDAYSRALLMAKLIGNDQLKSFWRFFLKSRTDDHEVVDSNYCNELTAAVFKAVNSPVDGYKKAEAAMSALLLAKPRLSGNEVYSVLASFLGIGPCKVLIMNQLHCREAIRHLVGFVFHYCEEVDRKQFVELMQFAKRNTKDDKWKDFHVFDVLGTLYNKCAQERSSRMVDSEYHTQETQRMQIENDP